MTNRQIILIEQLDLMKEGKIKCIGQETILDPAGNEKVLDIPEPIHTYAAWKQQGYQVRKGEKAIAKFTIWKYVGGKHDSDEDGSEDGNTARMFLKDSAFFSQSQVDKIMA